MKLIKIKNQLRRDFDGIYECEGCKNIEEHGGCYDDSYFHNEVTPKWKCNKCGESTDSLGVVKQIVKTRYPDGEIH